MDDREIEALAGVRPRLDVESILNHPRFAEAHALYLREFLAVYDGDPFLVRLLIESGRFFVHILALLLEANHQPANRETWPTVGLLKEKMAMFGFASDRHIDQLIARLCEVGYMQLLPSEQDRRVRLLTTTEKMRTHDMDWRAAHFAPLTVQYPHHDYRPVMARDQEFHSTYRGAVVALLPLAARVMASIPDTMLYFNRAGGSLIIAALLHAAREQGDPEYASVPYADLGDRFGLSRTHVRKVLADAEAAEHLKLHGKGGRKVELLPRLWRSHGFGAACGMFVHDLGYLVAVRQLQTPALAQA